MSHRQAIEYLPTMFPVGHELAHQGLKPLVVGRLQDVDHFVDHDVLQALRRLLGQIGVEADGPRL